jgi:hypothetical protein
VTEQMGRQGLDIRVVRLDDDGVVGKFGVGLGYTTHIADWVAVCETTCKGRKRLGEQPTRGNELRRLNGAIGPNGPSSRISQLPGEDVSSL